MKKNQLICLIASLLFITLIFVISSCTSCSASGRLSETKLEKVVIIDGLTTKYEKDVMRTAYKVNRIEKGVVTYISIMGNALYEKSDTILWKF